MNQIPRNSKIGALHHLRHLGFLPATVIDVGVQKGTPELYHAFPDSLHVLIEPVVEQEATMKEICSSLTNAVYILAAAAAKTGRTKLRVSHNAMYSNMTTSEDAGDPDVQLREVPTISLDDLTSARKFPGPMLLKIDVDGQEVDVLKGATKILREYVEYVVVESTMFGQINQVIAFMQQQNFAIYDVLEPLYRPLDLALWQVDLAFVRKDGPFRIHTGYNTPEAMREMKASNA